MKKLRTRLVSAFLVIMTLLTLLPTSALAASGSGTGIKPTDNTNYWTTRLLHDGTPYSYKPPMAAGKLLYCLDRGYGYRWGTASFLNSYTYTSATGADADTVLKTALAQSGMGELDAQQLENFKWMMTFISDYDVARPTTLTTGTYSARLNYRVLYKTNYNTSYQVLASNLLTGNNYSFSLNAIPMQAGEVVTDIYFDFGKVPVGFQSVVNPTLSVMVNGNAVNGYQMVNRADVGGKYQGTWQTATASWVTIIRRLWNTPTLPKTGY